MTFVNGSVFLRLYGSIYDPPMVVMGHRSSRTFDMEYKALQAVEEVPSTSARQIVFAEGTDRHFSLELFKSLQLQPSHIQRV